MQRTPVALAMWARLSYTSVFERVNVISASPVGSIPYGALTSVLGAPGPSTTIILPNATAAGVSPAGMKECHDVGVLNADGGHPIVIAAPDGKNINGSPTLTLPASPGAFAWCFFDVAAQAWFAITAAGGGALFVPPPTYTAKGPVAPQALTGAFVAIGGASVTTAPFTALQKAIISCSVTMSATAGTQDNVTTQIFDGVATTPIDTFEQTVGNSAVDVLTGFETWSWTLEVPGNGLARTFGLAAMEVSPGAVVVPALRCRTVVQIVDG